MNLGQGFTLVTYIHVIYP